MSRYESDDEQVEALKKWWKENGTSLLSTLLVVVIGWSGWTYYQTDKMNKALEGSTTFELLQNAMQAGQFAEVAREGLKFIESQPESPYAVGIALMEAKYHIEKKEYELAKKHFDWVIENSKDDAMRVIGATRLASLQIDLKAFDEAAKTLARIDVKPLNPALQSTHAFYAGQLALAKQDLTEAKTILQTVIDNEATDVNIQNLAQLQLDDLAK